MNSRISKLLSILCCIIIIIQINLNANADVDYVSELDTEALSEERQDEIKKNIIISKRDSEGTVDHITNFSVSPQGLIAISNDGVEQFVNIYDDNGSFLYGYSFDVYGTFYVDFNNENVTVYLLRGSLLLSLNVQGDITDIREVKSTENSDQYLRNSIQAKTKKAGIYVYRLLGPKIEKYNTEENSSITVLDCSTSSTVFTLIFFIPLLLLFIFVIIRVYKLVKETYKNYNLGSN